jgi:hypothetical protein
LRSHERETVIAIDLAIEERRERKRIERERGERE